MDAASKEIIQLGYVVPLDRYEDCIAFWQETTAIGPLWEADFTLDSQIFRGQPTHMSMRVALGYCGDQQIELIAQLDDQPSPYKEWLDRHSTIPKGGLFHHYFLLGGDYDETMAAYARHGGNCAFTAVMPNGGRLAYMDTTAQLGHYVEFVDRNDDWLAMFARMREGAALWDGSRPRRSLEEVA